MSLLVETIRLESGKLLNISFHNERMMRSRFSLFGLKTVIDLEKFISIPEAVSNSIFKCRVEYDREIRKIEFLPYIIRPVRSLKLVEDNKIEYQYKYLDRTAIEKLMADKGECDDIIIIKNDLVTDSSYANLVFRGLSGNWFTPVSCLLKGIRRSSLLSKGHITETEISLRDIEKYSEVRLINAMIGIDDTVGIPVANIV